MMVMVIAFVDVLVLCTLKNTSFMFFGSMTHPLLPDIDESGIIKYYQNSQIFAKCHMQLSLTLIYATMM